MSFAHPLLAWGALLSLIPIIIHLLSRRRFRVVRWAAMDFLLAALAEKSRRVQLEDLILMVLRAAVVALAALAVARPILSGKAAAWARSGARGMDVVIVLDTSYSMSTNIAGETRMALACRKAHALLASLPESSRIGVIRMGESAGPATQGLLEDRVRIGAAIDETKTSAAGADAGAALSAAIEMLKGSTAADKRVFLITDAQARTFDRNVEDLRRTIADADQTIGFTVLAVPNSPTANLALSDLHLKSRWLRADMPAQFDAVVRDVGEPPTSEAAVELWIDSRKVERRQARLENRTGVATFRHAFGVTGLHTVEVRLDPDAIDVDDRRFAAVLIPASIDVAVVDPSSGADQSAYIYVRTALESSSGEEEVVAAPPFSVQPVVSRDRLAEQLQIDPPAVVILSDAGALPLTAIRALTDWAQQGGAILVSAGQNAVATLGQLRTGEAGVGSLLAGLSYEPPDAAAIDAANPLQFAADSDPTAETVLHLGSPGVREAISAVNVFRALTVQPSGGSGWAAVLKYTDGRPALLTRDRGGDDSAAPGMGRVALLTTSLDASWTDLPYRPALVPLLYDTLLWLVAPRMLAEDLRPGQTWTTPIADASAGWKVFLPGEREMEAEAFLSSTGKEANALFRFDRTAEPGVYRLAGPARGTDNALHAAVVNPDVRESDQVVWSADGIRSLFPEGRCQVMGPESSGGEATLAGTAGSEIWPMAAALLLALLMLEMVLAYIFGLGQAAGAKGAGQTRRPRSSEAAV